MYKERINKLHVLLITAICLVVFAVININYWAISHAESESEWDDSKWNKQNCGDLIVSAECGEDSFSYDTSASVVTIHIGKVKVKNVEGVATTETSIAIKTNSDNATDDIEVGLDGVNIESKNCAFDIIDDSVNVNIFLIGASNNTLKLNGDEQPGIRKSANSGCLYISSENGSDAGMLTSTGSNGGEESGKGGGNGINGDITIKGGTINTYGGNGGGDGDGIGGTGIRGDIEINGGSISCEIIERQPVNNKGENVYLATVFNPKGDNIYVNGSKEKYNCPPIHSQSDRHLYLYLPKNKDSKLKIKLANTYNFEYSFKDGKWEKEKGTAVKADNYDQVSHFESTYKWDLTNIEPIVLSKLDKNLDNNKIVGPVGDTKYRFDSYVTHIKARIYPYVIKNLNLEWDEDKKQLSVGYLTETPGIDSHIGFAFRIKCICTDNDENVQEIYIVNKEAMKAENTEEYILHNGWFDDGKDQDYRNYAKFNFNTKDNPMSQIILKKIYGNTEDHTISEAIAEGDLTFEISNLWTTDN